MSLARSNRALLLRQVGSALLVLGLFVASDYLSAQYAPQLVSSTVTHGPTGLVAFVLLTTLAEVVAPLSALPLLPAAVRVWSPLTTILLGVLGWTMGALIAFLLARHVGRPLVRRLVDVQLLNRFEGYLPRQHLFTAVILMRLLLPTDLVSYALGLFTSMPLGHYLAASTIGITGSAFLYVGAATLPLPLQVIAGLFLLLIFVLAWQRIQRK